MDRMMRSRSPLPRGARSMSSGLQAARSSMTSALCGICATRAACSRARSLSRMMHLTMLHATFARERRSDRTVQDDDLIDLCTKYGWEFEFYEGVTDSAANE